MNREIKFRAWDERQKKMFNVDVLAISACTWDCPDHNTRGVSMAYQPNTPVMQYTGLKDKNGVEIYEGDILEVLGAVAVVEWRPNHEGEHCFRPVEVQKHYLINNYCYGAWDSDMCEVVGNCHSNPELLEAI